MPLDRPLLTIAIPTYNRSECLAELLEVLTPQLAGESRVELIVSDNASPDDTPGVIASFREKGLALNYNRNEINIGADGNFIRCYELARGEYVWIFGDDDIILPGGLREVLNCLETREHDLVYVQATRFQGKYQSSYQPEFSGRIRTFTPRDFALFTFTNLTFISANISRKAALESLPDPGYDKLAGTSLAQLSWTFELLRRNAKCACLLDRIVANRTGNGFDVGTCDVFGTTFKQIVEAYFGSESQVGSALLNRTIQCFFPWSLLQSRRLRNSKHSPEDAATILEGLYQNNPRYWFFVYPVLRLPIPLARVWLIAGKVLNRLDQIIGYPIANGMA